MILDNRLDSTWEDLVESERLHKSLDFTWEDLTEPEKVWFSALDLLPDKESFRREFFSDYISEGVLRPRDRFINEMDLLILARLATDLGKQFALVLNPELLRQQRGESVTCIRDKLGIAHYNNLRTFGPRLMYSEFPHCLSDFFSLVNYASEAILCDPDFTGTRPSLDLKDFERVRINGNDPATFLLRHLARKAVFRFPPDGRDFDRVDHFIPYFKKVTWLNYAPNCFAHSLDDETEVSPSSRFHLRCEQTSLNLFSVVLFSSIKMISLAISLSSNIPL